MDIISKKKLWCQNRRKKKKWQIDLWQWHCPKKKKKGDKLICGNSVTEIDHKKSEMPLPKTL